MKTTWALRKIYTAITLVILVALVMPWVALADDISNNVDATVDATLETMNLTAGGAAGSTQLRVITQNGDGKNGCNLTGGTTLTVAVNSSNAAVVTVSPSSITFASCSDTPSVTVTPVAQGSANVTLSQTSNNTGGTFNLVPASFTVNVAAPAVATTSMAVDAAAGTFGGSMSLSAALTSGGSGVNGKTVNFTLNGSSVGAAATNSSGVATLSGVSLAGINAGSYPGVVGASFTADSTHAASSGSAALTVNKASASITLSGLSHTHDGSPKSASASTNPAGLSGVSITYGGSTTVPTNAGSYAVEATLNNDNYSAPAANGTLVIDKASQTINFAALDNKTFGDAAFQVSATGGASGSPVTFAAHNSSGVCSVSGTTVSVLGAGTCAIRASQAGNVNYEAALDVDQSFSVAKAGATLSLSGLNHTYDGTGKGATVSTDPANLSVVSVTYAGGTVLPVDAGSYAVAASLDNANYAADPVVGTLVIDKANQQISFGALGHKTYGDAVFEVSATGGGSGNAVAFAATGNCTVALDNGKWMVTLGDAGSCAITASQAGSDNYNAADPVERAFLIAKATATINLTDFNHTYDGSPKSVSASTNPANLSGVSITYGGSATAPASAGSYAVEATLDNANYTASPATGTLVIAKANQMISFGALAVKVFGDAAFQVSAIGGASGNAVTFAAINSNGICSVSGATVSILGKGICTIRASQAGNVNYGTAPDVDQSFQVTGWTVSGFYNPVTMGDPSQVINSVKSGSTVPLKFELFKGAADQSVPAAVNELTATSAIKSMNAVKYACGQTGGTEDPVDFTAAGKTELRYDSVSGQFIYNWQTPSKQANSCYKVTITMQDSSTLVAYFKLK